MNILFRDVNIHVVSALTRKFNSLSNVKVEHSHIFYGNVKVDALISPANSSGDMQGGIDMVYLDRFGFQLETELIKNIQSSYGGVLPIGKGLVISTKDYSIPNLISVPTMDWPPQNVCDTENAYKAFKAALMLALEFKFDSILCPGMCTLTGGMMPSVSAAQMRKAYDEVFSS